LPRDRQLEPVGGQPGQQLTCPFLCLFIVGRAGHVQCRPDHVTKFEAAIPVRLQFTHLSSRRVQRPRFPAGVRRAWTR
jgi:hypothetical protein